MPTVLFYWNFRFHHIILYLHLNLSSFERKAVFCLFLFIARIWMLQDIQFFLLLGNYANGASFQPINNLKFCLFVDSSLPVNMPPDDHNSVLKSHKSPLNYHEFKHRHTPTTTPTPTDIKEEVTCDQTDSIYTISSHSYPFNIVCFGLVVSP